MIEREVNVFDSTINLHPIEVENIDSVINLTFEPIEITSQCEEVKDKPMTYYTRKRKVRRVKAAGIF